MNVVADVKTHLAYLPAVKKNTEDFDAAGKTQDDLVKEHDLQVTALTEHYAAMSYIISQTRTALKNEKCIVRYAKAKVNNVEPPNIVC